eukprot:tig00021623_g23015.t1
MAARVPRFVSCSPLPSVPFTVRCGPAFPDDPFAERLPETAEFSGVDVPVDTSSSWCDGSVDGSEALSASEVAEICRDADNAFRLAWHYLNRYGASDDYVNQLAIFCSACLEMYRRGFSPRSMELEMSFTGGIPRMVASDRSTLRVWMTLVFRVFQKLQVARAFDSPSEGGSVTENAANLHSLVDLVIGACSRGFTLETLKLEMALKSPRRTPLESVLLSQWMRLCFTAIDILAHDEEDGGEDDFDYPADDILQ